MALVINLKQDDKLSEKQKITDFSHGTKLSEDEQKALSIFLRVSHGMWMIRKVHQAKREGNESVLIDNVQVKPYEVLVKEQCDSALAQLKTRGVVKNISQIALVLTALEMFRDCRRTNGDPLKLPSNKATKAA